MQLTEEQKKRFLDYLDNKKTKTSTASEKTYTSHNGPFFEDIFTFSINDIIIKSEQVDFYKNSSEEAKNNFKINITQKLLAQVAVDLIADVQGLDEQTPESELIKTLFENPEIEEVFSKLAFYLSQNQSLANNFIRYTAFHYIEMCNTLKIPADPSAFEIINS